MLTIKNLQELVSQIEKVAGMPLPLHDFYIRKLQTEQGCQEIANRLVGHVESERKRFTKLSVDSETSKNEMSNTTTMYLAKVADVINITIMIAEDGTIGVEELLQYIEMITPELRLVMKKHLEVSKLTKKEREVMLLRRKNELAALIKDASARIGYKLDMKKVQETCFDVHSANKALIANQEEANQISVEIKNIYNTQDTQNIEVRRSLRDLLFSACKTSILYMAITLSAYNKNLFQDEQIMDYAENKRASLLSMSKNYLTFKEAVAKYESQGEPARGEKAGKPKTNSVAEANRIINDPNITITEIQDNTAIKGSNAESSVNSNNGGNSNMNNQRPVAPVQTQRPVQAPVAPVQAQQMNQAVNAQSQIQAQVEATMGNMPTDGNGNYILDKEALSKLLTVAGANRMAQTQNQAPVAPVNPVAQNQSPVYESINNVDANSLFNGMAEGDKAVAQSTLERIKALEDKIKFAESLGVEDHIAQEEYCDSIGDLNELTGKSISTRVSEIAQKTVDYINNNVATTVENVVCDTGDYVSDLIDGFFDAVVEIKEEVVSPLLSTAFNGTVSTGRIVGKLATESTKRTGTFAGKQIQNITGLIK